MADNSYPMVLYRSVPGALTTTDVSRIPIAGNAYGAVNVQLVDANGHTNPSVLANAANVPYTTYALPTISVLYVNNATTAKNEALKVENIAAFDSGVPLGTPVYNVVTGSHNIVHDYNTDNSWLLSTSDTVDGINPNNAVSLDSNSYGFGFNGSTFDRVRVANKYNSVDTAAAGNTAVWTPAAGKKFRLMGGIISVSGTGAALTSDAIQLRDGSTTVILRFRSAIAVTVTGDTQIPFDLGQGYLSSAANNVLNVNIATPLTAGGVSVNVWGTEE